MYKRWCHVVVAVVVLAEAFHLGVSQDVVVTVAPARRLVAAGKDVGFECGVRLPHDHRLQLIVWQKADSEEVPTGRSTRTSDGIFILRNVQPSDSGIYTCAAESMGSDGRASGWSRAVLTVVQDNRQFKVAPNATVFPIGRFGLVQVQPNTDTTLSCLATGHPVPYYHWRRKSGKPLPQGRHFLSLGKLTIFRVAISDVDEYICTAANTEGADVENRFLLVGRSGWATWNEWELCTVSCGRGRQTRRRTCPMPPNAPSHYKSVVCKGAEEEQKICEPGTCPPPPTTQPPTTRLPTTQPRATTHPWISETLQRTPPPVVSVDTVAPSDGNSLGCWRDTYPMRVLPYAMRVFWDRRMVPDVCIDHCSRYHYRYAGIENGNECWCGGNYMRGGRLPNTDCSKACSGNAGIRCGGVNALSVYAVPQDRAERCQATLWGAYDRPLRGCGLEIQQRIRGLRDPNLYCSNLPRLRQERLVKIRPCRLSQDNLPKAAQNCQLVRANTPEFIIYGNCRSEERVQLNYCIGRCSANHRCTYRRVGNRNVKFRCANGVITTRRIAIINSCQCRSVDR